MKITKYSHACLLVEEGDARIVIDPGSWNETPDATHVNAILITHEHGDHFDRDQIHAILQKNQDAVVISHPAVASMLAELGPKVLSIDEGGTLEVNGVSIQSFGHEHAVIYGTSPCRNTGYLIGRRLYVPGDALHDIPGGQIDALALPTGGPWMKLGEAIEYAKKVNPKIAFPIHDAMHIESYKRELVPRIVKGNLEGTGIHFSDLAEGRTLEV